MSPAWPRAERSPVHSSGGPGRALAGACWVIAVCSVAGCGLTGSGTGEEDRSRVETVYDKKTGRLQQVLYDSDRNGTIDTRSYMDGTRILRIEFDRDEDGKIDRWEYYDERRRLEKVGFSRANDGKVDAWAFEGPDGDLARVEVSTRRDGKVDRTEYYAGQSLQRAEQDTNDNGVVDKWETYTEGHLRAVAFDHDGDGRPDRRLTYDERGDLLSIETEPSADGTFRQKVAVSEGREAGVAAHQPSRR